MKLALLGIVLLLLPGVLGLNSASEIKNYFSLTENTLSCGGDRRCEAYITFDNPQAKTYLINGSFYMNATNVVTGENTTLPFFYEIGYYAPYNTTEEVKTCNTIQVTNASGNKIPTQNCTINTLNVTSAELVWTNELVIRPGKNILHIWTIGKDPYETIDWTVGFQAEVTVQSFNVTYNWDAKKDNGWAVWGPSLGTLPYRINFTVNRSMVNGNLTNFTTYVSLGQFPATFWGNVTSSTGLDMIVTTDDGATQLPREVVWINTTAQTGELWFQAPNTSTNIDTSYYLYFGNSSLSTPNNCSTWDGFEMVYHLQEVPDGSVGQIKDSSCTRRNGTAVSTMGAVNSRAAKIGNGLYFNGAQYINITNGTTTSNNISVQAYANEYASLVNGQVIQTKGYQGTVDVYGPILWVTNNRLNGKIYCCGSSVDVPGDIMVNNSWHAITFTTNDIVNIHRVYSNGTNVANSTTAKAHQESMRDGMIGAYNLDLTIQNFFNGIIDEVRYSKTILGPEWVKTEYDMTHLPANYIVPGTVESFTNPGPVSWNTNLTNSTVELTLISHNVSWNTTDATLDSYIFYYYNSTNTTNSYVSGDNEAGSFNLTAAASSSESLRRYNFSLSAATSQAFSGNAGTGESQPLSWAGGFTAGTNITTTCATNLSTSNDQRCNIESAGSNTELFERYDFVLNETLASLSWIYLTLEGGRGGGAGGAEDCQPVLANYTSSAWVAIGSAQGTEASNTLNITGSTVTQQIINTTAKRLTLGVHGDNMDSGELCAVDFVQAEVAMTINVPSTEQNTSYITYEDTNTQNNALQSITSITIQINVSYYNTSLSATNGNTNATVSVEVYNGSTYIDIGNFSITAAGKYNLSTSNESILVGWATLANRDVRLRGRSLDWSSSTSLDNVTYDQIHVYVNTTQKFINDSPVLFSGCTTLCVSNNTKIAPVSGTTVQWYVYANNSIGLSNTTSTFSYTTTTGGGGPADSCTPTAGQNWVLVGSDNCNITTSYNLGNYNITCSGTGTITWINAIAGNTTFFNFNSGCRYKAVNQPSGIRRYS